MHIFALLIRTYQPPAYSATDLISSFLRSFSRVYLSRLQQQITPVAATDDLGLALLPQSDGSINTE